MYSAWIRGNAVFFFGLAVLAGLCTMCAWSTAFMPPSGEVSVLRVNSVRSLRLSHTPLIVGGYETTDRAMLTFDLQADLSQAFNWNVKQLFVFVVAEFATPTNKLNQVVIWDHVVPDAESAVLKYADEPNKYPLVDQGTELRGVDVRLRLYWDSMPLSGSLLLDRSAPRAATMPSSYT